MFTKRLAVMLKSGVSIVEALETLKDQTQNPYFIKVIKGISKRVVTGESLEKSVGDYPRVFDKLFVHLVAVGERSGNLAENLEYLAAQFRKEYEFKSKIGSVMIYPSIVLVLAIAVGAGISLFVLPQLLDMFKSLDVQLPLATRALLWSANLMKYWGVLIWSGVIVFIVAIKLLFKTKGLRLFWDRMKLKIPVIGDFLQQLEWAEISRNLAVMIKSGLTLNLALEVESQATANTWYRKCLLSWKNSVETGLPLSEEMKKNKLVPGLVSKMIEVGEKTGELDKMLFYLAEFYEENSEDFSRNFQSVLEPAVLLLVALLVAFIALSIISPIYSLTGSVHR